jgi:quercetin dioxygenase-like cupin family protein
MKPRFTVVVAVLVLVGLSTASAFGQQAKVGVAGTGTLVIKPLAEKKVAELPAGPLYWRVESFATLAQAQAAAGSTGLVAESAGKAWLFTLGPAGGSSNGGTKMAEMGPLPPITAPQYLLRVNEASGPSGSVTPVHNHPGIEAAYVLAGEQTFRTPHGVVRVGAGKAEAGHAAETAMQVSSSGSVDLHALVMFVLDATKPFSSPATLP